jgi:hypothetical protein
MQEEERPTGRARVKVEVMGEGVTGTSFLNASPKDRRDLGEKGALEDREPTFVHANTPTKDINMPMPFFLYIH